MAVYDELQKLVASDARSNAQFGCVVDVSGNTAIMGAYGDTERGSNTGAAYIFARSGGVWTQQQELLPTGGDLAAYFGWSVAVDGDTAVVGAMYDDGYAGAVYVFTRSGTMWTQQARLLASDGFPGLFIGQYVALSADTVIAGTQNMGGAYIFTRSGTTWTQEQKLYEVAGFFGGKVAIDGDTVVVAAMTDNAVASNAGSAYIFTRSGTTWTLQQKLTAPDAAASDHFGTSVAIDGDTVVIGAEDTHEGAITDAGSAYVFTRSGITWTMQQKLIASDAAADDAFGIDVSVYGDTALIGAYKEDDAGDGAGAAYAFTRSDTTWTQQAKLIPADGATGDRIGWNVAIDNDVGLISATGDDDGGAGAGAAYVFEMPAVGEGSGASALDVCDWSMAVGFCD